MFLQLKSNRLRYNKNMTMFKKIIYSFVIAIFIFSSNPALLQAENNILPGSIVINEILQDPAAVSNGNGEWFEVYNTTGNALDLNGCVISDLGTDSHTIISSVVVPAYGYAVLGRNGNSGTNGNYVPNYVYGTSITLANTDDEIILTCAGMEIDRVAYTGILPWPDPTGKSMILAHYSLDNNNGANWCISSSTFGMGDKGTPGAQNDVCTGIIYCGNGIKENGEECDDGNMVNGDGCSNACKNETPTCPAGQTCTSLTRGMAGGTPPIVKAKWEMLSEGNDDSTATGAQFLAPNVWNGTMNYNVCAIATDPNGAADIVGVYADIYYPASKAIHNLNPSTDIHPDTAGGTQDFGQGGCNAFIEENTLIKMSKDQGYNLFCNKIRTNNNNLPKFSSGYDYNEICNPDGELMKETAYVYCDTKILKWEDPAGNYTVKVFAQDKAGNNSVVLENQFEYLPLTSFEKDFTNVSYGQVMLNTDKKIAGDLTWGNSIPSIRNLGNTRLWMKIAQDDMGLGQSSGVYNVQFDARIGNNEKDWSAKYYPFKLKGIAGSPSASQYTQLEDILDLSKTEEIDFSILVAKWPNISATYTGTMWLEAVSAPFRICQ